MSELYTAQLLGKPFTTQSMMGSPGVVQGVAGCRGLHGEHLGMCHVEEQAPAAGTGCVFLEKEKCLEA